VEKYNRNGVNALQLDPALNRLFTAGRDSIIRIWSVNQHKVNFISKISLASTMLFFSFRFNLFEHCLCTLCKNLQPEFCKPLRKTISKNFRGILAKAGTPYVRFAFESSLP
jgi:WD40 repeat protein